MKRVSFFFTSLILVLAFLVMPVLGAELAGGYYIVGDSAIGNGLTFYIPSDYAAGCLTYDSSGCLFNLTSSSIYLYCVEHPDYVIYAKRFSGFQYSTGGNYTYVDLNLRNVTDTNVEILVESPRMAFRDSDLLIMILSVCLIGVGAFVILRR